MINGITTLATITTVTMKARGNRPGAFTVLVWNTFQEFKFTSPTKVS